MQYCSKGVVKHGKLGEGNEEASTPQRGHGQLQQPVQQLPVGYLCGSNPCLILLCEVACLFWEQKESLMRRESLLDCGIACRGTVDLAAVNANPDLDAGSCGNTKLRAYDVDPTPQH